MDARAGRTRARLGEPRGKLGHELRSPRPDGEGERRFPNHGLAHAPGGVRKRLVPIQPVGPREVEVELIARRLFDRGREPEQHLPNLTTLGRARLPRHRHNLRSRAQPDRPSHGHRRVNAVGPCLVRRGRYDAAPLSRTTDDQEGRLAGPFRIDEAGDGDVERVGVGEENPAVRYRCSVGG